MSRNSRSTTLFTNINYDDYLMQDGGMTEKYGQPIKLPNLSAVEPTISGFSSGAYMTHQMHIIYSDFFHGAGVMAGGPFACASMAGFGINDTAICSGDGDDAYDISTELLVNNAKEMQAKGLIADLDNLKNTKIWVESTALDEMVNERIVDKTVDFYRALGNDDNLKYRTGTISPHAF